MSSKAEWIYHGIWKVLSDLFQVPREPPDLPAPAAAPPTSFQPDEGYLRYLKAIFWAMLLATDVAFAAGYAAIAIACVANGLWWVAVLLLPIALFIIVVPDIVAYVAIHLRYDTTWYVMSDRSLRIRRGVWTVHETTITFENVQNVKIQQGPLQRHFGIANLLVETAGGGGASAGTQHSRGGGSMHTGVIEGIANAPVIRDRILQRLRESRRTGLGDEEHPVSDGARWATTAHVEGLRAILHEIRAMRGA